ncbi:hypothetical protein G7Y89_g7925 [Cudoniella acicularis]|uniref:Azaphilone pigments biosynthesis cluster protein L N-terminal domain-containing protein n=1 Tax=Cudoniella acicularis TaxID=354080 RepID=A0A8H4RL51_9HELO|nr:hypothetical protein G7Y89_g7925 [Cudoniella acicularis]
MREVRSPLLKLSYQVLRSFASREICFFTGARFTNGIEALGGAASVIAVITITCQSTQIIYQTFQGIKDGLNDVRQLLLAVEELDQILRQLSSYLGEPENQGRGYDEMDSSIRDCATTLGEMTTKLARLHPIGEKPLVRAWRAVKTFLQQELEGMRKVMQHHAQMIGLQMNVIEMGAIKRLTSLVTQASQNLDSKLNSMSNDLRHSSQREGVTDNILNGLIGEVNSLSSISRSQFEILKSLLENIQPQKISESDNRRRIFPEIAAGRAISPLKIPANQDSKGDQTESDSDSEVPECIERLSRLANKATKTVSSPEAQEIIEDMEKLLEIPSREFVGPNLRDIDKKRKRDEPNDEILELQRDWQYGLMGLVEDGKASLTDRDPLGRSLLSFSVNTYQLDTCRFLIEHGADVNSYETALYVGDDVDEDTIKFYDEINPEDCSAFHRCIQILLENSADPIHPSFQTDEYTGSAVEDACVVSPYMDVLKILLNYANHFVHINQELPKNGNTLLLASAATGNYDNIDIVSFLLDHGANTQHKDIKGNSCLHIVFLRYQPHPRKLWWARRALQLMLAAGADPYAYNYNGDTVTEGVGEGHETWEFWEEVVGSCGLSMFDLLDRDSPSYRKATCVDDEESQQLRKRRRDGMVEVDSEFE